MIIDSSTENDLIIDSSTENDMINDMKTLQMVKENILSGACIMKVSVNKQLLSFVKSARQIYEWDLEVKQKLFQGEKLKNTKKENEELVENFQWWLWR